MAQKTKAQITAEITALITDNSTKDNTASNVRAILNDMNDSFINSSNPSFSTLYYGSLQIISTNVLTGFAVPVKLVSAMGAGTMIEIVSAIGNVTYNTITYATNLTVEIFTDTSTDAQFKCTSFLGATTNTYLKFEPVIAITPATARQFIANKDINFRVKTGNPTAGNSDITIYFTYRILNF